MEKVWRKTSRHRLVFAFGTMAVATYFIPLQKFFTMGRYQHYGLAVGMFGLGYLLQTIWSWNIFSRWARIAYLSTGIFALIVGITFYYSPWLDTKMCQPTPATENMRRILMLFYVMASLFVGGVYGRWVKEENSMRSAGGGDSVEKAADKEAGGNKTGGIASGTETDQGT